MIEVSINGQRLPNDRILLDPVLRVGVRRMWDDPQASAFTFSALDYTPTIGSVVEVAYTYKTQARIMFVGKITDAHIETPTSSRSVVTITCMSRLAELGRRIYPHNYLVAAQSTSTLAYHVLVSNMHYPASAYELPTSGRAFHADKTISGVYEGNAEVLGGADLFEALSIAAECHPARLWEDDKIRMRPVTIGDRQLLDQTLTPERVYWAPSWDLDPQTFDAVSVDHWSETYKYDPDNDIYLSTSGAVPATLTDPKAPAGTRYRTHALRGCLAQTKNANGHPDGAGDQNAKALLAYYTPADFGSAYTLDRVDVALELMPDRLNPGDYVRVRGLPASAPATVAFGVVEGYSIRWTSESTGIATVYLSPPAYNGINIGDALTPITWSSLGSSRTWTQLPAIPWNQLVTNTDLTP